MKEVIIINDLIFSSKTEAERNAKKILNSYTYGDILNEDDFKYMLSYFEYFHYEWYQKKGIGVEYISIKKSDRNKHNEFKINRIDGSFTDISYRLSNIQKPNPSKWFKDALRYFINDDILVFKDNEFKDNEVLKCVVRGVDITRYNSEVDHYNPTFDEMVMEFINKNNIEINVDLFDESRDNQTVPIVRDKEILNKFKDYHSENCSLRVISIKANRSDAKIKPSNK